jgi:hypothetical protein
MIIPNEKFNMTEELLSQYGVRMRLLIKNLASRDFSGYKCISQNSMGNTEGTIHIHGALSILSISLPTLLSSSPPHSHLFIPHSYIYDFPSDSFDFESLS